jgi:hypothetical protein
MKELFEYIREHPYWTLIYLLVISSVFNGIVKIRVFDKKKEE